MRAVYGNAKIPIRHKIRAQCAGQRGPAPVNFLQDLPPIAGCPSFALFAKGGTTVDGTLVVKTDCSARKKP